MEDRRMKYIFALLGAWLLFVVSGISAGIAGGRSGFAECRDAYRDDPFDSESYAELPPGGAARTAVGRTVVRRNSRLGCRFGNGGNAWAEAAGFPPLPPTAPKNSVLPPHSAARLPASWFRPNPVRAGPAV